MTQDNKIKVVVIGDIRNDKLCELLREQHGDKVDNMEIVTFSGDIDHTEEVQIKALLNKHDTILICDKDNQHRLDNAREQMVVLELTCPKEIDKPFFPKTSGKGSGWKRNRKSYFGSY